MTSIEEVYKRYDPGMMRYTLAHIRLYEDAEDVVSEAWLALLAHQRILCSLPRKKQATYVYTALNRKIIDYYRKRQFQNDLMAAYRRETEATFGVDDHREELRALLEELTAHVSVAERRVLLLLSEGCTYDEIAVKTHMTKRQAYACRERGLRRLRKITSGSRIRSTPPDSVK